MKNILAENMLRFGVKNLQESDIKKIEESSLNEVFSGTFEQAFPDYKAASAAFAKAHAAGGGAVSFTGKFHHYYSVRYNPDTTGYNTYDVGIIGLGLRKFRDIFIADIAAKDENVTAYWDPSRGIQSPTNWPDFLNPNRAFNLVPYETTSIDNLKNINYRFNQLPLADIQKMLPQYPNIMANLKAVQANTNWSNKQAFSKGLTGNAKMFYNIPV